MGRALCRKISYIYPAIEVFGWASRGGKSYISPAIQILHNPDFSTIEILGWASRGGKSYITPPPQLLYNVCIDGVRDLDPSYIVR